MKSKDMVLLLESFEHRKLHNIICDVITQKVPIDSGELSPITRFSLAEELETLFWNIQKAVLLVKDKKSGKYFFINTIKMP